MEIFISPKNRSWFNFLILLLALLLCASCGAVSSPGEKTQSLLQMAVAEPENNLPFRPVFLVENAGKSYNKIGSPKVGRDENGDQLVLVDPATGILFEDKKEFVTPRGKYTNLIYRVHFEQVPWSFDDIHLTAGKNVGLLVIYTFNAANEMVLLTTVHTCGCFLAFFPTDNLPIESLPDNWPTARQTVYQQILPAFIKTPRPTENERILIRLEDATHRVSWVETVGKKELAAQFAVDYMQTMAMESLWHLPFADREVSFFEEDGWRKGYVRDSFKPFERLLLSWLALDWYVGEDKAYGYPEKSNTVFYTSLKFWQRNNSDMEDFAGFLQYWGWRL